MSAKNISRSLASVATFQDALAKAKRETCCLIAEIMESDHNDVVESVKHGDTQRSTTFEEVMEEGFSSYGHIYPYWGSSVTLFLKKENKGKKPEDWVAKPFSMYSMDLITPDEWEYADDVVVKFQLIGKYLDSKGEPLTQSSVHINCVLIERHEGTYPEFMLEEEYELYVNRNCAA